MFWGFVLVGVLCLLIGAFLGVLFFALVVVGGCDDDRAGRL